MTDFAERLVPFADGAIAILEWQGPKPDAPLLHFAHGTGMNGRAYRRLLAPLAARFRIAAWDGRGHGHTTLPADPADLSTWDTYVRDLGRLVEALNHGRPALLVGHSLGGVVSMELAATRPDLAAGTMALDPPLVPEEEVAELDALRAIGSTRPIEVTMGERAARRRADWPDRQAAFEAYRKRGAFATWDDEWLIDYLDGGLLPSEAGGLRLACTPAWEAQTYRAISADYWRRMAHLRCPATVLYGDRMGVVPQSAHASFARIAPAVRTHLVPGASHFLPMEFPGIVAEEINALADRAGL